MIVLDTNVVSELRRARPHGAVLAWLRAVSDSELHLCAITIGELQSGIEITREQDPAKAPPLEYSRMGHRHLTSAFEAAGYRIAQ